MCETGLYSGFAHSARVCVLLLQGMAVEQWARPHFKTVVGHVLAFSSWPLTLKSCITE